MIARTWIAAAILMTALAGGAGAHGPDGHADADAPASPPVAWGEAGAPVGDFPVAFGGAFSLTDQDGRRVSDADFRGRHMLVVFGYARCERMCPLALERMAAVLDLLGADAGRIAPILITVDPADDPGALGRRLAEVDPRLIGLTGSEAELTRAAKAYHVDRARVGKTIQGTPVYRHGSYIYLLNETGAPRAILPPVLPAERMAAIVRRHLTAAGRGDAAPAG